MERIFTILAAAFLTATIWSQSPEKMSYQAVIRDADNNLVKDKTVGMKISILQGSESGTAVYAETQTPGTNANGLVSIEIGEGTAVSGNFSLINWSEGPYFIQTETDPGGGTNYTISGTSQLLSVPYALHAKTAENVPTGNQPGEMQYWDGSEWITIEPGDEGQILTFVNGVPAWKTQLEEKTWPYASDTKVVEVTNPETGQIWMDRNLGASRAATASDDEQAYGDLYQWGRAADGHEKRTSGTTSTLSDSDTPGHDSFITINSEPHDWRSPQSDKLWQGVNGTNNPCPKGFRLPTEAELDAERQSWSSNDAAGAYASPLKWPLAGHREVSDGSIVYLGTYGRYWSSTIGPGFIRVLDFGNGYAYMGSPPRGYGVSVRCIKD